MPESVANNLSRKAVITPVDVAASLPEPNLPPVAAPAGGSVSAVDPVSATGGTAGSDNPGRQTPAALELPMAPTTPQSFGIPTLGSAGGMGGASATTAAAVSASAGENSSLAPAAPVASELVVSPVDPSASSVGVPADLESATPVVDSPKPLAAVPAQTDQLLATPAAVGSSSTDPVAAHSEPISGAPSATVGISAPATPSIILPGMGAPAPASEAALTGTSTFATSATVVETSTSTSVLGNTVAVGTSVNTAPATAATPAPVTAPVVPAPTVNPSPGVSGGVSVAAPAVVPTPVELNPNAASSVISQTSTPAPVLDNPLPTAATAVIPAAAPSSLAPVSPPNPAPAAASVPAPTSASATPDTSAPASPMQPSTPTPVVAAVAPEAAAATAAQTAAAVASGQADVQAGTKVKTKKGPSALLWVLVIILVASAGLAIWQLGGFSSSHKNAEVVVPSASPSVPARKSGAEILAGLGVGEVTKGNWEVLWRIPGVSYLNHYAADMVSMVQTSPEAADASDSAQLRGITALLETSGYKLDPHFSAGRNLNTDTSVQFYTDGTEVIVVSSRPEFIEEGPVPETFGVAVLGRLEDLQEAEKNQKAFFTDNQVLSRLTTLDDQWWGTTREEYQVAWKLPLQQGMDTAAYVLEKPMVVAEHEYHEQADYQAAKTAVEKILADLGFKPDTERTWQSLECTPDLSTTFYSDTVSTIALGAGEMVADDTTYYLRLTDLGPNEDIVVVEQTQTTPSYAASAWVPFGTEKMGEENAKFYVNHSTMSGVRETSVSGQTYYAVTYDPHCDNPEYFVYYTMKDNRIEVAYEGFVDMDAADCELMQADTWLDDTSKQFLVGEFCQK